MTFRWQRFWALMVVWNVAWLVFNVVMTATTPGDLVYPICVGVHFGLLVVSAVFWSKNR